MKLHQLLFLILPLLTACNRQATHKALPAKLSGSGTLTGVGTSNLSLEPCATGLFTAGLWSCIDRGASGIQVKMQAEKEHPTGLCVTGFEADGSGWSESSYFFCDINHKWISGQQADGRIIDHITTDGCINYKGDIYNPPYIRVCRKGIWVIDEKATAKNKAEAAMISRILEDLPVRRLDPMEIAFLVADSSRIYGKYHHGEDTECSLDGELAADLIAQLSFWDYSRGDLDLSLMFEYTRGAGCDAGKQRAYQIMNARIIKWLKDYEELQDGRLGAGSVSLTILVDHNIFEWKAPHICWPNPDEPCAVHGTPPTDSPDTRH